MRLYSIRIVPHAFYNGRSDKDEVPKQRWLTRLLLPHVIHSARPFQPISLDTANPFISTDEQIQNANCFNVQLNSLYSSQEPPEKICHLTRFAFCHVLIHCVCCDCFPSTNYFTALSAKIACHSRAFRWSSWKKISTNNNWLRKPVPLSTQHLPPHATYHMPLAPLPQELSAKDVCPST